MDYGIKDEKGTPTRMPRTCAVTGSRLGEDRITIPVTDDQYLFYCVTPTGRKKLTRARRAEIEAEIKAAAAQGETPVTPEDEA